MNSTQKEIDQLKTEIEYYKKMVQWYRDTYETRSILGVVKEKLNKKIKDNVQIKKIINNTIRIKSSNHELVRMPEPAFVDKSSFYSTHATDQAVLKIGIFIHLFYLDLWPEINDYLQKIGINFDLLITVNEEDDFIPTIDSIKESFPDAIILKVPNKGLDVGPFFELVNYAIAKRLKYDYILKFHTKKSIGVDAQVGESWRKKSYESLMGSYGIVSHILRLFAARPAIGMIGPYETRMSVSVNDLENQGNANANNLKTLSRALDISDQTLDFFGGTMFWVKWSIFEEKFKKKTLTVNDFERGYKKDELLSHAMERLLASVVRDAGYQLYEMDKINDYIFYKNRRKKVCWVHPGYGIGGGNRVIFEICQEQLKYYDVYSISFMGNPFNNWIDTSHSILNFSTQEHAKYFIDTMDIDFVFATGWQTVEFVKGLSSVKKKFYFIQDYEPWFADADAELAKATYHNPFNSNIVIAEWLKQHLVAEHKLESKFTKLGTRPHFFKNSEKKSFVTPKKILIYFKLKTHYGRGADLVLQLLKKLVKNKELELNVFGHEDPGIDGINFYGEVHKDKLLDLYVNNDVFVDLSRHRGIATIALETAQFGVVPFLSSKEYGLKEYGFVDNENCVFVEGVDDAYSKIVELMGDMERYNKLKENVMLLSKTFRWEYTVKDINQITDIIV